MLKRYLTILIAIGIVGTIATVSFGQWDDDAFVVTISPTISYSVFIASPDAAGMVFTGMDLDEIAMSTGSSATSNQWPSTATVYNDGNSTSDWTIKAVEQNDWKLTGRNDGHTFDSVWKDTACISIIMTTTTANAYTIADADFTGVVGSSGCVVDTNETNMDGWSFCSDQGADILTGDDVPKQETTSDNARILWVRVHTPDDSTYSTAQNFKIIIYAYDASTF
jgi:hypothetical protein